MMDRIYTWLALAGAVILLLFGVRHTGRQAEKINQLERRDDQRRRENEILDKQNQAAADRPRGRDDLRKRMQDGSF